MFSLTIFKPFPVVVAGVELVPRLAISLDLALALVPPLPLSILTSGL
jgi:hypothetical protein